MPIVGTRANASARAYGWSATIPESLDGMVLMMPSSIASTGTGNSSSIGANGSVTFSSCATLSLNGVFTTDYDNYIVVIRNSETVADVVSQFRLRASGTDNSTAASYTQQSLVISGTLEVSTRAGSNIGTLAYSSSTTRNGSTTYFYAPKLAQATAWKSVVMSSKDDVSIYDYAGTHSQSTAYDGLTLIPDNGLSSGLVSVYGLEN